MAKPLAKVKVGDLFKSTKNERDHREDKQFGKEARQTRRENSQSENS
jgi:hypothetical protein